MKKFRKYFNLATIIIGAIYVIMFLITRDLYYGILAIIFELWYLQTKDN